jgi:hypothetical protein
LRALDNAPIYEEVLAGGQTWVLRRLSLPLLRELAYLTPRDAGGLLDLESEHNYAAFMAAVFYLCLRDSENRALPFFEATPAGFALAHEMANDSAPALLEVNAVLLGACLLANPDIFPEATAQLKEVMAAVPGPGAPLASTSLA